MSKRIFNIVSSRPDTTNPTKKYWMQHGILIFGVNNKGQEIISIKLNSLPIAANFEGWLSVFPVNNDESHRHSRSASNTHDTDLDQYDDSIPFDDN